MCLEITLGNAFIKCSVNGHMECRGCFDLKQQCGKCNQKMVDVPAKFAEMITEQFNVQCSYAEKGCTESVAFKVTQFQNIFSYSISHHI